MPLNSRKKAKSSSSIYEANRNWKQSNPSLDNAKKVVAFEIRDTGIGISRDKQNIIFEAFQQAEGLQAGNMEVPAWAFHQPRSCRPARVVLSNWKVKLIREAGSLYSFRLNIIQIM